MRAAPLSVWCYNIWYPEEVLDIHKAEAELTHSNEIIHVAIMVYSLTIYHLLENPTDPKRAIKAMLVGF